MLGDTFCTLLLSGGDHLNTKTEPSWRELLPTMSTAMILSITHDDLLTHMDKIADNIVLNITDISTLKLDKISDLNKIINNSVIINTNPPTVAEIAKFGNSRKRLLLGLHRLAHLLPKPIDDAAFSDIPSYKTLWLNIKNLGIISTKKNINIQTTAKFVEQCILEALLFLFSDREIINPTNAALLIYTLADICRTLRAIYQYDSDLKDKPTSLINQHLCHLETVAHAYLASFRSQLDCDVAVLGAVESYCNCLESSKGSTVLLTTSPYAFFQRKENVFDYAPEHILKPLHKHAAAVNLHYMTLGIHYAAFSGHTFLVDTPLFKNPDTKQLGMIADYANSRLKSLVSDHEIKHLTFLSRVYFQDNGFAGTPEAISDLKSLGNYFKKNPQALKLLNCLAKSASLYEFAPLALINDGSAESTNCRRLQSEKQKSRCHEHRQSIRELFVILLTMIQSRDCKLRQETDSLDHFVNILILHIQQYIEQNLFDTEMRAMKLFALSCLQKSMMNHKTIREEWQQFSLISIQAPYSSTNQAILRRIVSPLLAGMADFKNNALIYSIIFAPDTLWGLLDHYNKTCLDVSISCIGGVQSAFETFHEQITNSDTLPPYLHSLLKITKKKANSIDPHQILLQASRAFQEQLKKRTLSILDHTCKSLLKEASYSTLSNPETCVYFFRALSPLLRLHRTKAEHFGNTLIECCQSFSRKLRDCHWITYWQHILLPTCAEEQLTNISKVVTSCFKKLLEGSSPKEILLWIKDIQQVISRTNDNQYYHRLCSLHASCGYPNQVLSSVLRKAILSTAHEAVAKPAAHEAVAKPAVGPSPK